METHMTTPNPQLQLRKKMLGVQIKDARKAARKTTQETAVEIGMPTAQLTACESGRRPITLPELEALAYAYDIPIRHFLHAAQFLTENRKEKINLPRLVNIRQKMISTKLRQLRAEKNLRLGELSKKTGISIARIKSYESGARAVPILDLESLAIAMAVEVDYFLEYFGPVGEWAQDRESEDKFHRLPAEIRRFAAQPQNEPYVRLAMRLSGLPVGRLREFAEAILDITL
jgi:transcriptional regulator with XRE-family HTH domain